jgi:glutamate 5-kinase
MVCPPPETTFDRRIAEVVFGFGKPIKGDTYEQCAVNSTQMWVRDQNHIAPFTDSATGLVMTSKEALAVCGIKMLEEAMEYASAVLTYTHKEPARSLILARARHVYSVEQVARGAGVSVEEVQDCENYRTVSDIHTIAKICAVLDLDPKFVGRFPLPISS